MHCGKTFTPPLGGMVVLLLGQSTDRRFAALVLTRKRKAITGPSVSFQQGSPGFQVRTLLTFAVSDGCHIVRPAACIGS